MPQTGQRNDPFLAFRFEVRIGVFPVAGFSDCTGLQLETEVQDYNEGGDNTRVLKFPTRTKQVNLVLKRGIVDRVLWDWYFALTQGFVLKQPGTVIVHDPSGQSDVVVWQFNDAFPCKWMGPELNASQNSVAVETLELCHSGLMRIK
jgi:phage tail-like protein